jgi:hypothetical protein
MADKTYLTGITIKEQAFRNGNTLLKVGIKVDEFIQQLKEYQGEYEWIFIEINKRREPTQAGLTHYANLDDYKNDKRNAGRSRSYKEEYNDTYNQHNEQEFRDKGNKPADDDDLPF